MIAILNMDISKDNFTLIWIFLSLWINVYMIFTCDVCKSFSCTFAMQCFFGTFLTFAFTFSLHTINHDSYREKRFSHEITYFYHIL